MPEEVGRQPTTGHQPQLDAPQDRLNERIGVLTRREAEARILAPLIEALGREFERERVIEIVRRDRGDRPAAGQSARRGDGR